MSNERKLGDIELQDYLRITRVKRSSRWLGALLVAGVCVVLLTALKEAVPWTATGKGALNLTYEDAFLILEREWEGDWQHEQGVGAAARHAKRLIELLGEEARKPTMAGQHATVYLYQLADRTTKMMREQSTGTPHAERHRELLKLIIEELKKT